MRKAREECSLVQQALRCEVSRDGGDSVGSHCDVCAEV